MILSKWKKKIDWDTSTCLLSLFHFKSSDWWSCHRNAKRWGQDNETENTPKIRTTSGPDKLCWDKYTACSTSVETYFTFLETVERKTAFKRWFLFCCMDFPSSQTAIHPKTQQRLRLNCVKKSLQEWAQQTIFVKACAPEFCKAVHDF